MVTTLSLIGWVAKHFDGPDKSYQITLAVLSIAVLSIGLYGINHAAFRAMDELEKEP